MQPVTLDELERFYKIIYEARRERAVFAKPILGPTTLAPEVWITPDRATDKTDYMAAVRAIAKGA